MAKISVNFVNEKQQKEQWCWAAVATNVFNSICHGVPAMLQVDVVQRVTNGLPNHGGTVDEALVVLGIRDGQPVDRTAVDVNFLAAELRSKPAAADPEGEPVCAEIRWHDQARHFVAISGVDVQRQTVFVEDPFFGPGNTIEYLYNDFVRHYGAHDPVNTGRDGTVQTFQKVKRH